MEVNQSNRLVRSLLVFWGKLSQSVSLSVFWKITLERKTFDKQMILRNEGKVFCRNQFSIKILVHRKWDCKTLWRIFPNIVMVFSNKFLLFSLSLSLQNSNSTKTIVEWIDKRAEFKVQAGYRFWEKSSVPEKLSRLVANKKLKRHDSGCQH